jgi:universal stress protein A
MSGMFTLRNILVPVDFSDTSRDALRYAREVGRPFGSRLHVLHVLPDPMRQPWAVDVAGIDFAELQDQWRVEAEGRLGALVAEEHLDPSAVTTAVVAGSAHESIVTYATEMGIDLVVVGTHGHGPIVHLLLGSVAERVVRQAGCPVLTIPHHKLRGAIAKAHAITRARQA